MLAASILAVALVATHPELNPVQDEKITMEMLHGAPGPPPGAKRAAMVRMSRGVIDGKGDNVRATAKASMWDDKEDRIYVWTIIIQDHRTTKEVAEVILQSEAFGVPKGIEGRAEFDKVVKVPSLPQGVYRVAVGLYKLPAGTPMDIFEDPAKSKRHRSSSVSKVVILGDQ